MLNHKNCRWLIFILSTLLTGQLAFSEEIGTSLQPTLNGKFVPEGEPEAVGRLLDGLPNNTNDDYVFAPPPGTPNIKFLRLATSAESEITIQSRGTHSADGYIVYRKILQTAKLTKSFLHKNVNKSISPIPDEVLSPYSWNEVYKVKSNQFGWTDKEISPINMSLPPHSRRTIGFTRCYKVRAYNNYGFTESPTICANKRGINAPSNLNVSNLTRSSVRLTWKDNSHLERGYKVYYRLGGNNQPDLLKTVLGENSHGPYTLNGLQSGTKYIVGIIAFDSFGESSGDWATITTLSSPNPDPPNDPPSSGIRKLIISNCHNDRKSVRLWTYDFTLNNGVWKNHGTLGSQWQGQGCPSGSPKEINISDNHLYRLVAIDCGNMPPNQTQGTCHKLTTSPIQGNANGASLTFQIN